MAAVDEHGQTAVFVAGGPGDGLLGNFACGRVVMHHAFVPRGNPKASRGVFGHGHGIDGLA